MKTEHKEQAELCKFLRANRIFHAAIPNAQALSGANRGAAVRNMAKLKAEGFQKGFPDILVILPEKLLVIEMKREKGGTVSKEQKHWLAVFNTKTEYAEAHVCNSAEEAISLVKSKYSALE